MTLAKKKFRYICIHLIKNHDDGNDQVFSDFTRDFYKRLVGLYGSINFHKSAIRIINIAALPSEFVIIKCRLEFIDNLLISLYFANYPLVILPVSGTIKKLRKRVLEFLAYRDFLVGS